MNDIIDPLVPRITDGPEDQESNPALRAGTPWGDAIAYNEQRLQRARNPRAARNAVKDGFDSTALYAMARNVNQRVDPSQGALSTIGQTAMAVTGQAGRWGESAWDKSEHYDELAADVPYEFLDSIFEQTTLEGARLTKANIKADLDRMQRMGLDTGVAAIHSLAGSLADIDAPLVLLSGGGFGVAKAAGRTAYAARMRGVNAGLTTRAMGTVSGLAIGAQAGVLVGGADALNRDTTTWMDGVRMALMTTAFGGALGAAAPRMMMNLRDVEQDFVRRVREGDSTVWDDPVSVQPVEPNAGRLNIVEEDDMSVGAAAAQGTTRTALRPNATPITDLGGVPVTSRQQQVIDNARDWVFNSGFKERYQRAMENSVNRVFASPWLNPGTNNVMQMVKSGSATLNWLSGTVYEVASGVVRGDTSTGAVLMRQFQGRLARHVNHEQSVVGSWAKRNNQATMDPTGNFVVRVKPEGYRQFYRDVILDMDAINSGGMRNADPDVQRMSQAFNDMTTEAGQILRGRNGELSVRGFENFSKQANYVPYRWYPASFMSALSKKMSDGSPALTQDMLIDSFAQGYMSKGTFSDPTTARMAAEALVGRHTARGQGIDDSIQSIFTKDGRDYLEQSMMRLNKYTEKEIKQFMRRFDKDMADARKEGFAKGKREIDLNQTVTLRDGSTMKLVDFMDPDLSAVMQRYIRQVSGSAALARKGITDRSMRADIIAAARAEQRSLGENPMDEAVLDAMFSEFDGAAQVGAMRGTQNAGIGAAAELKSFGSLSMLQLNGFAQAAETGVGMFAVGLNNWYNRGIKSMFDDAIKTSNKELFDELSFLTGQIGKDQYSFRPHLVLDEATDYRANDKVTKALSQTRSLIAQGNYIQGFTSGLNAVREFQQKVAWLGMSDKIFRTIAADIADPASKAGKAWNQEGRMYRDLGLTPEHYQRFRELIEDGTIEFQTTRGPLGETTYVNRLNLDKWDADLAQDFSSALARNEAQLVQRPLAGETDRWMHTHLGALLTHLQTFPILAIQKQGARNAGQMDMQAAAQTLGGIATAYVAINMRDVLSARERSGTERAKAAIAYANISGWIPLYSDPVMSILGLHDYRVNGFGAYAEPLSIPGVDIANNLVRAPGAAAKAMFGEEPLKGGDRAALRTLPFVRLTEMLAGMAGANLLDDPNRIRRQEAREARRNSSDILETFVDDVRSEAEGVP